jgi:hypothetical protein
MKLKTTNYWPKNWPIEFRLIEEQENWLRKNFTPRQHALVALYFSRQYKEATAADHAFFNWLEDSIEQKKVSYLPKKANDGYRMRPIVRQTCIHIVNCYITSTDQFINYISLSYWTFVLLNYALEFTSKKTELNDKFYKQASTKQNRLLSLFLPIANWKPSYHNQNTTNLAKTIYQTNNWEMCPILADALMDAACHDNYIIWLLTKQHHLFAKGIWIIDKLAGNV